MAERNILSSIGDFFTPTRSSEPAPNNLAAITFMQMQQDKNTAIQAEINNNQDVINAEYIQGMIQEFNKVQQAERANPEANAGAADRYLYDNMPAFGLPGANAANFQAWMATLEGEPLTNDPSFYTIFSSDNNRIAQKYVDELNEPVNKQKMGINPDSNIVNVKPQWNKSLGAWEFIPMIETAEGTIGAATVGGVPIVDLATSGSMQDVESNIIKLTKNQYNNMVKEGFFNKQTAAGLSPSANQGFDMAVNTTNAPDRDEVDAILTDGQSEVEDPPTSFGGGAIPTGAISLNEIPRVSEIVGEPVETGQIYRKIDDTSGHLVEVNTMQGMGSPNRREGSFATVTHYMPIPDSMEIPGGRLSNYSYYTSVDETGGYRVYSRLEREGSNTAVNAVGQNTSPANPQGEAVYLPKDEAVKMFTQFDSGAEFTGETNDVLNNSGVKQVNDSIPPNVKAQIRKAINDKNYSAAIDLIDNAVTDATLSVDDQTKLITYITKSQGNMFELNFNDRQAMAAGLFGALPKEDRNSQLKEALMYYLETGRFDVLGSTARSADQDKRVDRVYSRLEDITTGITSINADNLDFQEEEDGQTNRDKLFGFINELSARKEEIFATGDATTIKQFTNNLAFGYGTLLEDAADSRTGLITGIRRVFGFEPDARRPAGDLMPNIQGYDRNKVITMDPKDVQYVRYIQPGSTDRTQGKYVSVNSLSKVANVGTDALNFYRDVAVANNQYAEYIKGQ